MLEEARRAVAPIGELPVTLAIEDRVVTLAGTVPDAERRDALLEALGDVSGVRRVTDRLVVREPLPHDLGSRPDGSASPDLTNPDSANPDSASPVEGDPESPGEAAVEPLADAGEGAVPPALGEARDVASPDDLAAPSLRFDVADGVLTIDGELSSADDPATLIESAMDSFELDYVSDAVERGEGVAEAGWLRPLAALLPTLARLDSPEVVVSGRKVTLRGSAADEATREEIVEAAREGLSDYSLLARIDVAELSAASDPVAAVALADVMSEGETEASDETASTRPATAAGASDERSASDEQSAPDERPAPRRATRIR